MDGMTRRTAVLSPRRAWVVPQDGDAEGQVLPVMESAVLGCDPHAQIKIMMEGVLPLHAKIFDDGESWLLVNQAPNGSTRLKGEMMTSGSRAKLVDGDVIKLGSASLIFKSL